MGAPRGWHHAYIPPKLAGGGGREEFNYFHERGDVSVCFRTCMKEADVCGTVTALPVAASVSILLKVPVLDEVGACGWRENGVDLSGRHGDERKREGETQHGVEVSINKLGCGSFELDVREPLSMP
jgi:hypothetical protein